MRLGGAEDDPAADIGERAPHLDPAPVEVNVTHSQGCRLAPAQPGVGENEDQQAPGSGGSSKVEDLAVSEVDIVPATWAREAQPASRVRAETATAHGVIQGGRHDEHRLTYAGSAEPAEGQSGDPLSQARKGDPPEGWIGPVTLRHESPLLGEPPLSVSLACERLTTFAAIGTPVPRTPGVATPLDHGCSLSQTWTSSGMYRKCRPTR